MTVQAMNGNILAVAGTSAAYIRLAPGSRIRMVSARNLTKPGQRCQICLADRSFPIPPAANAPVDLSTQSVVLADDIQDGVNDSVNWSGDSGRLTDSLCLVVAQFWNCDAGDALLLHLGVDDE